MALIFLNRYFYPDQSATSQILSDLAFNLAASGQSVTIITSQLRYDDETAKLSPLETVAGVKIIRVKTSRFGRANLLGRAIDYATFYLSAAAALWWTCRLGDIVIAKTDPPMLSIMTGPIARLRGAHTVNWLQDLFPEVAEVVGLSQGLHTKLLYQLLHAMRDRSLKRASMNVVIGEVMATRLRALGVPAERLQVIPNWADGAAITPMSAATNALRSQWGLKEAFVVGYSGNLGRAHDVTTIIDAIQHIENHSQISRPELGSNTEVAVPSRKVEIPPQELPIRWLFIGGGAGLELMKHHVASRGLTSVLFLPYQPRSRLAESLGAADVHLVSLSPGLEGLIVPSKYYGIAAAARPAIFIGAADGEIGQILTRTGAGTTVAPGDSKLLATKVLEYANNPKLCHHVGLKARDAFDREFSKPVAMTRWQAVLDHLRRNSPHETKSQSPSAA